GPGATELLAGGITSNPLGALRIRSGSPSLNAASGTTLTVASAATIQIPLSGSVVTVSGTVTNSGTVTYQGLGQFRFPGVIGGSIIDGVTYRADRSLSSLTGNGPITVTNGGTLWVDNSGTLISNRVIDVA